MLRSPRRLVRNLVVAALGLLVVLLATEARAHRFSSLVVFGDSLSDTGNMYAYSGGAIPPGPPYAQRFSNGPLWSEYLASKWDIPLVTFAVAGALTTTANFYDDPNIPLDFPGLADQIDLFLVLNPGGADPRALHVVWAGANDVLEAPVPETIPAVVGNLIGAVNTLRQHGATHIAVVALADLGLTPEGLASGLAQDLTAVSAAFNAALTEALAASDDDVIWLDLFSLMNDVLDDHGKRAFKNVTTGCVDLATLAVCERPKKYAFWDGLHPTTRGHEIIADEFAKTIKHAVRKRRK
jgi:outer membrane lipase/esterase